MSNIFAILLQVVAMTVSPLRRSRRRPSSKRSALASPASS